MAAFTTTMTTTSTLDDHLITLYDDYFFSAADLSVGLDALVTYRKMLRAKTISFAKYAKLTRQTSALTETDDVTSEAMTDSEITLTPVEYGNVVTTTKLVDLQTGGQDSLAAVEVVGKNARESQEGLFIACAEASSNELIVTQAAESSLTASDILTRAYVDRAYNKLRRAGIPGPYYAIVHPDVAFDLKNSNTAADWNDLGKYTTTTPLVNNEIGMFRGFRFIESPLISVNADAGNSTVDTYHSIFMGYNAIGKAVSQEIGLRFTGPFDKLARFVNIGWYGTIDYGIVDSDALWVVTSASSIGANS